MTGVKWRAQKTTTNNTCQQIKVWQDDWAVCNTARQKERPKAFTGVPQHLLEQLSVGFMNRVTDLNTWMKFTLQFTLSYF